MYGPTKIIDNKNYQRKTEENRIVKNNNLKIYDNNRDKTKNINFSPEKQYIDKFNVLIEPDLSQNKKDNKYQNIIVRNYNNTIYPEIKPEKKIEKVDNENQTLNNEYIISKQNKNDFTIYSDHNQKQLLFNNERTQFDSINSFSIEIDKKKSDWIKGINLLGNIIKKNRFKELIDLLKDKNNNNPQKIIGNLIQKRNDIASLKKFFDIWKNPYSLRERILKRVVNNIFKKKLNLRKMIQDLSNNDKNDIQSKIFLLSHYMKKWKDIANALTKLYKDKKGKKRISMRKNINKRKNKNALKEINKLKKDKKEKEILKKYLEKWKENALNTEEIINHKNILLKLKEYQKNKLLNESNSKVEKDKENETNELINKLKKALLQPLLHIYKEQKNKLLKKYFNKWKQNAKKSKKYIKKIIFGGNIYKSQDKKLSNYSSVNNSLLDSNSSNINKYYPTKVNKYSSIDKIKKNHNVINMSNNIKKNSNLNDRYYKNNDSNIQGPFIHTYNTNDNLLKNISFGDYKSVPTDQNNIYPNEILEKIKTRTEKYSNELQNSNITQSSDLEHKKNVSMIQRIKQFYRSPNPSGIDNTNINTNLTSYRSNNILNNPNQNLLKKKKKKTKKNQKYLENINKEAEEKKEQLSDDSSVNNSVMGGMKLKETKTENLKPIIYTSQSFFIDKKAINPNAEEIPSVSYYKNITNKFPMKMKGDFRKLIEKNPEILKQKNPRIQVTNATCELEQFGEINKNIFSLDDINLLKLNPNVSIKNKYKNKNKDMTNIVNNCDRDIYEPHKLYEQNPQRWISMSIPLKNGVAKWEFLNSVKGEKHKNNTNKFELIQKNKLKNINNNNNINTKSIKLIEKKRGKSNKNNKSHSLSKISEDSIDQNIQYNLREMNYTQFYRSPLNTYKRRNGEDSVSQPSVILVKKEGKKNRNKKKGPHHSRVSSADYNSKNS